MKRIKVNTTFEEDEGQRNQFYSNLSYSERLRYYFKLRDMTNFHNKNLVKGRVFKIYYSHNAV
jgi:hypothetical protein